LIDKLSPVSNYPVRLSYRLFPDNVKNKPFDVNKSSSGSSRDIGELGRRNNFTIAPDGWHE
jgi:hypothetical protein